MDNHLVPYRASTSMTVSTALDTLEARLYEAAQANVAQAGEGFTQLELHSMTIIEELKLINSMDLAAVLLRGRLLREIEDNALWANHPGAYQTMEEMARDQGISLSELSNVRDLYNVIFPYMEETLQVSVAQLWEQIGKSNFRELIPVMKGIITGQRPHSATAAASIERILDDTAATAQAAGLSIEPADLRRMAVDTLLSDAGSMTNTQLRGRIRPERTPAINPAVLRHRDGDRMVLMSLSDDQWILLQRKLGSYMEDTQVLDLPEDAIARRREVSRLELVRRVMGMMD
jgi:hypothetical protein